MCELERHNRQHLVVPKLGNLYSYCVLESILSCLSLVGGLAMLLFVLLA